MSAHGDKKNPDKMNTVSIATVGLAGSAVVYLSIIGIQAIYLNETSKVDEVAQFGRQGETRRTLKAEQVGKITEPRIGAKAPNGTQLYVVPIDTAMQLVVRDVAVDPANLIPAVSRSEFTTIKPAFGRPQSLSAPLPIGQSAPPPPPPDPAVVPGVDPGAVVPAPGPGATPAAPTAATPAPATPAPATPAPATPAQATPATTPTVPTTGTSR